MKRDAIKDLVKERGLKVKDALALTPAYDPFYMGSSADHTRGRWAKELYEWVLEKWDERRAELETIGISVGSMPHLRAIHYLLFTGHPDPIRWDGRKYEGTKSDWEGLQDCFKKARLLGYIKFGEIEDHKHPAIMQNLERNKDSGIDYPQDEGVIERTLTFDDLSLELPYNSVKEALAFYAWEEEIKNIQRRIPVHIEIWTEKQRELVDIIAKEYWVNVQNAVGQQTYENVYSLLKRGQEQSNDRPIRILYLSDFDPRGEMTMTVGVSRIIEWMIHNLSEFEGLDVKLKKLVLTQDQIREYNLPPAPVKSTESMKDRWDKHIGMGICEIDSIETLFAPEMVQIIRDELGRYIPKRHLAHLREYNDKFNSMVTTYNSRLREAIEEETEAISNQIKALIDDWSTELSLDLSDEYEKIIEFQDSFEEPSWEIDDGEDDWLFDSDRLYLEQIRRYKEVRGD